MNRIVCTTILLIFLIGSALADVHAATHMTTDPGDCALCANYGNSSAAPANLYPLRLPKMKPGQVAYFPHTVELSPASTGAHPRAPPSSF